MRNDQFFKGEMFGLPNPVRSNLFGRESASLELVGLTERELECVVAVLAADFTQLGPVCASDLDDIVGCDPRTYLYVLARKGWLAVAGKVERSNAKLYAPTARAWRALFPGGWSLLREVA